MEAYPDDRFQTADEFRRALLNSSSKTQHFTELDLNISVPPPPEGEEVSKESLRSNPELSPSTPVQVMVNAMTTSTMRLRRRMRRYTNIITWGGVAVLALTGWFLWNNNPAFHEGVIRMLPPEVAQTLVPPTPTTTPTTIPPTPTIEVTPTITSEPTGTQVVTITPTPRGGGRGQLAFVSTRNGGIPQVWLIDANGNIIRQITNEPNGACQPDWSPDGTRLVYVSPCRQKQDTYPGSSLYIVNADGSGVVPLPTSLGGNFEPAWSPDGRRIAFTSLRDGYNEIYMVNLDNNQTIRLTKSAASISGAIYARMPAWSPFGSQIAFVLKRLGTSQIWITTDSDANLPKPYEQLVKSGNTFSDFLPAWTPDGQFIVFNETTINAEVEPPAWLMSIRYEERATKQAVRLPLEPLPIVDANFSLDGFWMAFESWPDVSGNQDIYIATITGANRTRLTTDPAYDFDPVWRPAISETAP
jgi:Tol biopolymer transport system component